MRRFQYLKKLDDPNHFPGWRWWADLVSCAHGIISTHSQNGG
jgi:hypothetical protein